MKDVGYGKGYRYAHCRARGRRRHRVPSGRPPGAAVLPAAGVGRGGGAFAAARERAQAAPGEVGPGGRGREREAKKEILGRARPARLALLRPVVRRFLRDDHVVHVALAEAGGGDANRASRRAAGPRSSRSRSSPCRRAGRRPAGGPSRRRCPCAATGPRCPRAPACSLPPVALEVELVLEVAVAAAAAHRADRAHAAVLLEAAALVEDQSRPGSRRCRRTGCRSSRRARADGDRLGDVAREADAAVGDHRDVVRARPRARTRMIAVIIGTPMPATTRVVQIEPAPMPTLTASTPRAMSAAVPSAVATLPAIEVDVGEASRATLRDHVEHALRVAVRGVDDEHVDVGARRAPRRARACRRATPTAAPQRSRPSESLDAFGILDRLLDVLDGDQPLQPEVAVDDEQLLDLVLVQDLLRLRRASCRPAP